MPRHHLLPIGSFAHSQHAGAPFLVDRHGYLHPLVDPPLPQVPGAHDFAQTNRWPIFSVPLPHGPGITVSVDYFGPLPLTPRGNFYALFFTDRFSRCADMCPVTAVQFTAASTADILVDQCIPLWGCPTTGFSLRPSSPTPSTNALVSTRSTPARITRATVPALSASTTPWP